MPEYYELMWEDGGDHRHRLIRSENKSSSDGTHAHIWLAGVEIATNVGRIRADSIIMSMWDGAHSHGVDNEAERSGGDGKHSHGVEFGFPGGVVSTAEDGDHDHLLLVRNTARDGIHAHDVTIGGTTMRSLLPMDIVKLLDLANPPKLLEVEREANLKRIDVIGGKVLFDGVQVCGHQKVKHAVVCGAARKMLLAAGFEFKVFQPNFHGTDWLMKAAAEQVSKEFSGKRLGGGLLGAMSTLLSE